MGDNNKDSISLKVLSWNINGVRTIKNLKETLDSLGADVLCLQETKIARDTIDEETAFLKGYNSYFSFSKTKSGYSGVATYCTNASTPVRAEEGLSGLLSSGSDQIGCYGDIPAEFSPQELRSLDSEGRALITQHNVEDSNGTLHLIHIINVYCPRADPERPERLTYKLNFYHLLELRASALRQVGHVIIVGDINTSHREIDRCEQLCQEEFENNPGRQWLNNIVLDTHCSSNSDSQDERRQIELIDSFRHFHPSRKDAYTCWNTQIGARSTNYGSRIDYIFVNKELLENMVDSVILSDVLGSDHCPVMGQFVLKIIPASKTPSICSKYYPEFSGTQSTLSSFVTRNQNACAFEEPTDKKPKLSQEFNAKVKSTSQLNLLSYFKKHPVEKKTSEVNLPIEAKVEMTPSQERSTNNAAAAAAWRGVLKGPQPPPVCSGHNEVCVERMVKKNGPNQNRRFWVCARGEGRANDPNARCDYFKWVSGK